MRALVTGATGFIGRRLVDRLLSLGIEVAALTRQASHGLPSQVKVFPGDLRTREFMHCVQGSYERLYHCAALISFEPARRDELFAVNVQGTRHVLEAARQWNTERTVVVSSACTIGFSFSPGTELDEHATLAPGLLKGNPYLESKWIMEQEVYEKASSHHITIVNPTTVYGPGDRTLNSGTLLCAVARSPFVAVPPGGSNVVDVDDVVDGIIAAGERGNTGSRYILGGSNLPFCDIIGTAAEVTGHSPLRIPLPSLARVPAGIAARAAAFFLSNNRFITPSLVEGMFAYKYYSSNRARSDLQWTPQYSFRESAERAWVYYQKEGFCRGK